MPTSSPASLKSFHDFIGRQLASPDGEQMSVEEALARWREEEASVAAIREGLADIEAGRMRPAEDVIRELRAAMKLTQS